MIFVKVVIALLELIILIWGTIAFWDVNRLFAITTLVTLLISMFTAFYRAGKESGNKKDE